MASSAMSELRLHSFFNSSASYRVRIALHLKNLPFDTLPVNIRAGVHLERSYQELNYQGLVPLLDTGDLTIAQSLAIFDFLERAFPEPALIPLAPPLRAKALEIACYVACEMHPLNNLRVLKYLTGPLGVDEERRAQWTRHWLQQGFEALESTVEDDAAYCVGNVVTIADCFLIPQIANAKRVNFDMSSFPKLMRIDANCSTLEAFQLASPAQQPDKV